MATEQGPPRPAAFRRPEKRPPRRLGFELALVILVSLVVSVPGIWSYSLVDPWETHYGEVAREMLEANDWVHTTWRGTMTGDPNDNEGFRSKPVLSFWLMAAGMRAVGVGADGGYSGEMTDSALVMVGLRLPFVLCAVSALSLMWWMLARLVNRRLAWLGLLVVGSAPMFCLIGRQAIPDMPMTACTIGALSLFLLAIEDGDRPILPLVTLRVLRRPIAIDGRHVVLVLACGFILVQAAYYAFYFVTSPTLAVRGRMPSPALWLPLLMVLGVGAMSRTGWLILRLPFVLFGGVISAIRNEPLPERPTRRPGALRFVFGWVTDGTLEAWDRHALDRYLVRILIALPTAVVRRGPAVPQSGWRGAWHRTGPIAQRLLVMEPLTRWSQIYLLGCYSLLGISVLAKGPPGLAVVGVVGLFYVLTCRKWRELWTGFFEIKRGIVLMLTTFLPWHVAMFLKDGLRFLDEYLFMHVLDRAAVGVDNSPGTFSYYTEQIGHGMWLWAALLPAALACAFLRARHDTAAGRVRFIVALWAISAVSVFCLVPTKFHHYILPAVPPLGLLVAFLLDDIWSKAYRLPTLLAALAAGIVLLICRDLMHEPERWIEMFVFRYDRPWPWAEPWSIDPSAGFFGLGIAGACAVMLLATRFVRLGVLATAGVGLAICLWALHVYMPVAGTHWGMGDAIRTYYEERTVYGEKLVYYDVNDLVDDWADVQHTWSFQTKIPKTLHQGQPMTIEIELRKPDDDRIVDREILMVGRATQIGNHTVEVTLAPGERAKLDSMIGSARSGAKKGAKPPMRIVQADRLIAWQLYWRGENFWSGDEVWNWLPEQRTAFNKTTDSVEFLKYLNDRARAPLGWRYFVITDAGRITGPRSLIPTQRGRDTFEVLDTTSNKFSLAAFTL